MADDVDTVLVELLEHRDQGIQGRIEAAGNIRRVAGESDVARHDQLQIIAIALHLHPSTLQGLAQLGFLGIDVVAVATTGGTAHCRTDQGAFTAVFLARGGGADHRTRHRTDPAVNARLAGFTLTGVRIAGTACQHSQAGRCECQISPLHHA